MPEAAAQDKRWRNIIGLPVIAFVYREQDQRTPAPSHFDRFPKRTRTAYPLPAEVTGIEGDYIWVVLDGEEEPRKVFWCDVRPR